jgi:hypothetical protein
MGGAGSACFPPNINQNNQNNQIIKKPEKKLGRNMFNSVLGKLELFERKEIPIYLESPDIEFKFTKRILNTELVGDYKIELVSKRTTPSINISINLRTPFADKQYETVKKEVFNVKKIFPPFNPKAASIPGSAPSKSPNNTENISKDEKQHTVQKEKIIEQEKKIIAKPEIKAKEQLVENKIERETNNTKTEEGQTQPEQKLEKNMFKEEELADVDGVDYLNSLKVLEYKLKILEAQIAKISGRTPRELMQKKIKISCKIKMFQQQMGDGDVTPKDYYNLLTQQLTHDNSLFAYFKQEKDLEKAKLVAIRIKLMNEEIAELKQYL